MCAVTVVPLVTTLQLFVTFLWFTCILWSAYLPNLGSSSSVTPTAVAHAYAT